MDEKSARSELLSALMSSYEQDAHQFVNLPPTFMETCLLRVALAELRNEGYVEEQARGSVRLKPRGYLMCQRDGI